MMTSILEPTSGNVILCSILLIVSGVIVLQALGKFKMKIASHLFAFLFLIVGAYIPFYFLGTLTMNAVSVNDNSAFTFFFLQEQLALLNAPFALFESVSLFVGLIAILAAVALVIVTVFVVETIIRAVGKAHNFRVCDSHDKGRRFVCQTYIPNFHNTYLVTGRLRN